MTLEPRTNSSESFSCKLIGRVEELQNLHAALKRALRFEAPQFVTVLGEAGAGKTRLLSEWLKQVEEANVFQAFYTRHREVAGSSIPPYSLVNHLLRARFGIQREDDAETVQTILTRELAAIFEDRRVAELVASLAQFMGLEIPDSLLGKSLAMRPSQRLDLARAVLCHVFEQDGRRQPLLFVVDDAHLADEESLELIAQLSAELGETCVVFVLACRPEILVRRPDWNALDGSHVRMELPPLSFLEIPLLIKSATQGRLSDAVSVEALALESGGNPGRLLTLLNRNDGAPAVGEAVAHPEAPILSPATQTLIPGHRISLLSASEKKLLSVAASIGPIFWTGLLVSLGRMGIAPWDAKFVFAPDPSIREITRSLENLARRGFILQDLDNPLSGDTAWRFVDSVELSLLASNVHPEVTKTHRRFSAQWVEARMDQPASCEQLELLAGYCEAGGDLRESAIFYTAAGDQADGLQKGDQARSFYSRAIELMGAGDALLRIDTLHKLGDVCTRLGHFQDALAHFDEMLKGAWRLDLPGKAGAAHGRIGRVHRIFGDYARALQHLDMAHLLFDLAADRRGVAASLDDIGRVHFLAGRPEEALRCHRTALNIREDLQDDRGRALTLSWLGLLDMTAGELEMAQGRFESALAICQATGDLQRMVFIHLDLARLAQEAGQPERAQALVQKARNLWPTDGLSMDRCQLSLHMGETLLAQRQWLDAENELLAAREIAQQVGAQRLLAEADIRLAEIELWRGNRASAESLARSSLAAAEAMGAVILVGTSLRMLARILALRTDAGLLEARQAFEGSVLHLGKAQAAMELARTFLAFAAFEESQGQVEPAERLRDRAFGIQRRAGIMQALNPKPHVLGGLPREEVRGSFQV